ncbi:MAG: cardiolipin synthase [Myxococcales bacterium]|nr:cardiolipin synthase [Myxococcales bacterium]MDH3484149.1 cardiolipin synthase [Myxococcales bacterium]
MRVDWEQVLAFAPEVSIALGVFVAFLASGHVILNKIDTRAATAWVGLIWLVPVVGAILYLFLGINRIQRRAQELRSSVTHYGVPLDEAPRSPADLDRELGNERASLIELARVVTNVTSRPLVVGNSVERLVDGDEAYPGMLLAIQSARHSISFVSYIFEATGVGAELVDALADARNRGVEVRVLIDDVGARYARPRIHRVLRKRGVRVARFLPALLPRSITHFNLRNHRKIMVVDGRIGFTGGMNIRQGCVLSSHPGYATKDLHFRVEGPVVSHLQEVFAEDWAFATGEELEGELWFPKLEPSGETLARGIADGPDANIDALHWVFLAAVGAARRSIRVMTPYFLPDRVLLKALHLAAKRGVEVDVIVPETGNLPVVRWAMWGHYPQVLREGLRLWLTPPPFDHSKLFVVDRYWSSIGSTNWDPRSLRLNFEFNIECYDESFAASLEDHVHDRLKGARLLTAEELEARNPFLKLRDGTARLFTPYL